MEVGLRGEIDISPTDRSQAEFLHAAYAAQPQYLPEPRKNKGSSLQPRKAATFWGHGWRRNAAVRLLEIAMTARHWNRKYRTSGPRLPDATNYKSANPVAKAITTISYRWVAEQNAAAALRILASVISDHDRAVCNFDNWTPDMATPLAIDDLLGEKSGLTLLHEALKDLRHLPKPGKFGYTARSQAHLWLDGEGDDIAHYAHLQDQAAQQHEAALSGNLPPELLDESPVPPEVAAIVARQHNIAPKPRDMGHNQQPAITTDPAAARGTQLLGLKVSSLSTDPILSRLARAGQDELDFASAPR